MPNPLTDPELPVAAKLELIAKSIQQLTQEQAQLRRKVEALERRLLDAEHTADNARRSVRRGF